MKKAQGLSLNTIIVAVLALLVLIIMAMIFVRQTGDVRNKVDACISQDGQCVQTAADCSGDTQKIIYEECPEDRPVCCLTI